MVTSLHILGPSGHRPSLGWFSKASRKKLSTMPLVFLSLSPSKPASVFFDPVTSHGKPLRLTATIAFHYRLYSFTTINLFHNFTSEKKMVSNEFYEPNLLQTLGVHKNSPSIVLGIFQGIPPHPHPHPHPVPKEVELLVARANHRGLRGPGHPPRGAGAAGPATSGAAQQVGE